MEFSNIFKIKYIQIAFIKNKVTINPMNKLLIIQQHQFGYLTDSYKWCEYLREQYNITVVCYDTGKSKITLDNINIKYLKVNGTRYTRGIKFIFMCLWYILQNKKTIVVYFEKCHILKCVFPLKKMILDIRTLSVHNDPEYRKKYNDSLSRSCRFFNKISVISEGVAHQLNLPSKIINILPLGADIISLKRKDYSQLRLLYVGTLTNRDIIKTIEGVSLFIQGHSDADICYDIVGDGNGNELQELCDFVTKKDLNKWIKFYGRIQYDRLRIFFDTHNIGVSFVPITDYFEYQPPTKTFEYSLSGLYVIATGTFANKEIVTSDNGIIINDTPEDFAKALNDIYLNKNSINEDKIRLALADYTWSNIINHQLSSILNEL